MYYKANPVVLYQTTNLKGYAQSILAKNETWLVILIALAVILLILLLVVVFLRSRITIAIALIREGSKYVLELYKLLFAIDIWTFRHDFNLKIYIFLLLQSCYINKINNSVPYILVDFSMRCHCLWDIGPNVFDVDWRVGLPRCEPEKRHYMRLQGRLHGSTSSSYSVLVLRTIIKQAW